MPKTKTMICMDCEKEPGIWEILIRKQYRGEYGKRCGLFCNECLILQLEGFHTGGGITACVIEKIIRRAEG